MNKSWLHYLSPSELRRQFDLISVRITLLFAILFIAAAAYINGAVLLYSQAGMHQIRQVDSVDLLARAADQLPLHMQISASPEEGLNRYADRLIASLSEEDTAVYNRDGRLIDASLGSRLPARLTPGADITQPVEELAEAELFWDEGYGAQRLDDDFEMLFGPLFFAGERVGWQAIRYDLSLEQQLSQDVFRRSISGLMLILALILASGVYLRSFTRRNMLPLISATERIARSQWEEPLDAQLTGEFAQLGQSIDAMRESLQAYEHQRQLVLARISHDVLGPLKTISTIASLNQPDELQRAADARRSAAASANGHGDLLQEDWEVVAACSDHVNRLLEDIKYLVGGGRVDYSQSQTASPLALLPVLTQILAYYRTKTGTRVHFALAEPAPSPVDNSPFFVYIDRTRLVQMLGNLIDNALSHGQATAVTLSLRREGLSGGDYVCLRVQDNGVGIPAAVRPQIFEERFSAPLPNGGAPSLPSLHDKQRDNPHASHHGLGLSIVADIVRASGGSISVESAPLGGTTFILRLPAHSEAASRHDDAKKRSTTTVITAGEVANSVANGVYDTAADNGADAAATAAANNGTGSKGAVDHAV